jgi:hypothetical protein
MFGWRNNFGGKQRVVWFFLSASSVNAALFSMKPSWLVAIKLPFITSWVKILLLCFNPGGQYTIVGN